MRLLAESASGLRHLRWAREIHASVEALGADQHRFLASIQALSEAVKSYRDFLERVRVKHRGALRVALARAIPEEIAAARAAYDDLESNERQPRRRAVRSAVAALRSELIALIDRCEQELGSSFVDSVLPQVTDDGQFVIDDADEDDDATSFRDG